MHSRTLQRRPNGAAASPSRAHPPGPAHSWRGSEKIGARIHRNGSILSQGHDSIEHMIGCTVRELLAGMEQVVKALDPEALSGPESLEQFEMFHRIERLPPAGKALCARQMAANPLVLRWAPLALSPYLAQATVPRCTSAGDLGLDAAEAMKSAAGHRGQVPLRGPHRTPGHRGGRPPPWPIRSRRRSCWRWPSATRSSSCSRPWPGCRPRPATTTNVSAGPIAGGTSATGSTWRARSASPAASPPKRARS